MRVVPRGPRLPGECDSGRLCGPVTKSIIDTQRSAAARRGAESTDGWQVAGVFLRRHSDGRCGAGGSVAPYRHRATDPIHARRVTQSHGTGHTGAPARTAWSATYSNAVHVCSCLSVTSPQRSHIRTRTHRSSGYVQSPVCPTTRQHVRASQPTHRAYPGDPAPTARHLGGVRRTGLRPPAPRGRSCAPR